jgi:precorrin-2 dehydrogenase/sirohydrochlorin ferrochelatase
MNPQPGGSLIIAFQVKNKPVLVIGGGDVAMGRVNALLSADALVTLVAPVLTNADLAAYVALQQEDPDLSTLTYIPKAVTVASADSSTTSSTSSTSTDTVTVQDLVLDPATGRPRYSLVLTAVNTTGISEEVYRLCSVQHNIPVNVADVPPMCDFYFASMIRRGPLQVAVSTGGSAPRLARRIRLAIERSVDELGGVGRAIENVSQLRQALRTGSASASTADKATEEERLRTIKARMRWMSQICDAWSFEQLGQIDQDDIRVLVDSYPEFITFDEVKASALNAPLD